MPKPGIACPECKATNDLEAVTCKRCGEILSKSGKRGRSSEFDASEGALSPGCYIVPAVIVVLGLIFIILSFTGGAKPGTCAYNRNKVARAIARYNHANKDAKLSTIDYDRLMRPTGKSQKPYLTDRPGCPVKPSSTYTLESDGEVVCSTCGRK